MKRKYSKVDKDGERNEGVKVMKMVMKKGINAIIEERKEQFGSNENGDKNKEIK